MEVLFLLAYFLFIALVIEISATLFTLSGLNKDVARFQTISMLTNTGFTTDEAKLIIDHPIRRRISSFLILFGAFSLAVIISILSTYLSDDIHSLHIGTVIAIAIVLYFILKIKFVNGYLKRKLQTTLKEAYQLEELPAKDVLFLRPDDYLVDIPIYKNSSFVDVAGNSLFHEDTDVFLLLIKRGTEIIRNNNETIKAGDLLFVYGNKQRIMSMFKNEFDSINANIRGKI